ncbi:MAG: HAMP domain-containing histidine kinase, partial [Romboutsia sp.]|nr:HAMP domain-containing histidine kinase [Romboutsia sp.]
DTLKELKIKDLELDIEFEYLDIRKRNDKEYIDSFNKLLNTKYQDKDIDIVFTVDDEAFEFAKSKVLNPNSILYHKQIIFIGVNNNIELSGEYKKYMTGTLSSNTETLLLNIILYLNSEVDTVNIILDTYSHSNYAKKNILASKNLLFKDIKFNFIESNYIEDIKEQLKKIDKKNQANIIVGAFISKEDKSYINPKDVVNEIKEITDNPLYTNNYSYIYSGVIGGYMNIPQKQGEYVVRTMYNILNGKQNEEKEFSKMASEFIFNYDEIYKYNIDTFRIPKDSIIINKPKYALLIPKSLKLILYLIGIIIIAILFYIAYILILQRKKAIKNRKLYEIAKEREKLKTDFIVNMSHEFRTPLNVILSTSKVMELRINNNNYSNEYMLEKLDQINNNSNRLLKLVNNLIDITKFEHGSYELRLENLNIVEVVEDIVLASVDYSTCKNIDLIFDTEDEEIITAIDKDKIERVILNLLSNAIKFTDKDGIIYVYIKRIDKSVSISVQDNGIGIPKDKLKEIFNRFYQVSDPLKKHEEGSGIGLCIVEEIINLHGGKINVTSKVNEGTSFEIILPICIVENSFKSVEIKDINQSVKLEMSDVDTKEV